MLTRVEISKFKSCENLVLDGIGPITALVGRNGAGKTNILQAIDWTARTATRGLHLDEPALRDTIGTAIRLALPDGQYIYRIRAAFDEAAPIGPFSINESLDWVHADGTLDPVFARDRGSVVIGGSQEVQVGSASSAMPALLAVLPADSSILARLRPVFYFLQAIRYYPLDEPADSSDGPLVGETEYNQWIGGNRINGDRDDSIVYRLIRMKLEKPSAFDEIKMLLGDSGLGLIEDINMRELPGAGPDSRFFFLGFRSGGQSRDFRWDDLSLGTRRIVRLLVSLVYDESSVLLIEHPEDGIHRGLLRKVIGLLKTYTDPAQVILASHSGAVLNSLAPGEARLVSLVSGKTALRSLDDREIEIATHFLEEEGTLEDFLETIQQED